MFNNKLKRNLLLFSALFLIPFLYSEERKDYADYRQWQLSVNKPQTVSMWEELELNFDSYSKDDSLNTIQEIIEIIIKDEAKKQTFE